MKHALCRRSAVVLCLLAVAACTTPDIVEEEEPWPRPLPQGPGWKVYGTRPWRYIVVHHSASTTGSAAVFHRWHLKRGWRGLGYHFVIGNGTGSRDGEVEVGFRWRDQIDGAHAGVKEYNRRGVGICLVGNFERRRPSARQMEALARLVRFLQREYHIPRRRIYGHCDVKARGTACPGRYFPMAELKRRVSY